MHHPVFSLPGAAAALCLREGSIDAHQVIRMDEAPPFLDRRGGHAVSMDARGARVALEIARGDIHTKRAKLRPTECQLQTLVAHLSAASFGAFQRKARREPKPRMNSQL